jgi:hypothetical protein
MRKYVKATAGYDPACETLAEHFLQDDPVAHPDAKGSLSAAIQQAVESWFKYDKHQLLKTPEQPCPK